MTVPPGFRNRKTRLFSIVKAEFESAAGYFLFFFLKCGKKAGSN